MDKNPSILNEKVMRAENVGALKDSEGPIWELRKWAEPFQVQGR